MKKPCINEEIFFIGAGKMAAAFASGLLHKEVPAKNISAFDISKDSAALFTEKTGLKCSSEMETGLEKADVVILAVKPFNVKEALSPVREMLSGKILLSILAGTRIETLEELSGCSKVARVMPNIPALIGEGVSAYCHTASFSEADISLVEKILSAAASVHKVEEEMLDAVTGLSGSGPAFVFDFIEALAKGGHSAGLPEDLALKLAVETVRGAAGLVAKTGENPAVLRAQVVTPGGTTAHGLMVLEEIAFKTVVSHAVVAAAKRSKELGIKK